MISVAYGKFDGTLTGLSSSASQRASTTYFARAVLRSKGFRLTSCSVTTLNVRTCLELFKIPRNPGPILPAWSELERFPTIFV